MTEIPEHLLKRSKERRSAIGGGGDDEGASAPSDAAPVAAAAATPAVAAPAPTPEPIKAPEPDRPEVAAAKSRRRIPYWAMPVLVGLPLWAYVYQGTLEPKPVAADTPFALGEAGYAKCAACHGASGGGVSGPPLTHVLDTWPDYRDHLLWVKLGSTDWPADTYGATGVTKAGGMPGHADTLTEAELAEIVLYERIQFGGMDPASPEAHELEAISHGEKTLAAGGLGPESEKAGVEASSLAP